MIVPIRFNPRLIQSLYRYGSSSSSKLWLERQRSDPFTKKRSQGSDEDSRVSFVSRSAFKILELQAMSNNSLLRPGMRIVELGCSPGGWSQAILSELGVNGVLSSGAVIGVDLLPMDASVMAEESGFHFILGNFLSPFTQIKIVNLLDRLYSNNRVDLVLSDMLFNQTGNSIRDDEQADDLNTATLQFAINHLSIPTKLNSIPSKWETKHGRRIKLEKKGPVLVMKALRGTLSTQFQQKLKSHFESVKWVKPTSSRPESREGYWVCSTLKQAKLESNSIEDEIKEDDIYF